MTDEILRELKVKARKQTPAEITGFFSDLDTMNHANLDPQTFSKLHRWDRLALKYYQILRAYYERKAIERNQKDDGARVARDYPGVVRGLKP